MTGQHFLIVHEEPADGMDIEHPDDCPGYDLDGVYWRYECGVAVVVDETGLDEHFDCNSLAVGRHPVEYWTETRRHPVFGAEFECGLRLCDVPGGAA